MDELYDLQEDPLESRNLIFSEKHASIIDNMRTRLFEVLEQTGGMSIPLQPDRGSQQSLRSPDRTKAAQFPAELLKKPARPAEHK